MTTAGSEDGNVFVVKAEPHFELLQRNGRGIDKHAGDFSCGLLLLRTQHHLLGIGE